jgi:hypothetical protein
MLLMAERGRTSPAATIAIFESCSTRLRSQSSSRKLLSACPEEEDAKLGDGAATKPACGELRFDIEDEEEPAVALPR